MDNNPGHATIMVVDDNPNNLKILEEMLRGETGYRVLVFPAGAMALKAARKRPPDLLLLDIDMPDMDGLEVCARLKADDILQHIPVLFISALHDVETKLKAFSLGGVDYVTKPFQFEEVHARVRTHLELAMRKRELREQIEKLRQLEALRDNLVHMIAHDMRTPLMAIHGNLELMQLKLLPDPATAAHVTRAMTGTEMLLEMISSLLDVSRLEERKIKLDLSRTDIAELVNHVVRMFDPIKEKCQLVVDPDDELETVMCDANLIERVVQNLIGNAMKFTKGEEAVVRICLERRGGSGMRVSVADNGPGIPVEAREKIFDKFFQLETDTKRRVRSSGLGLTFCKLAVEAHGGRIGVESEETGGSRFWFELPRNQEGTVVSGRVPNPR